MKVGIIGPRDCTPVNISNDLGGIIPSEIISNGNTMSGFIQAKSYASHTNTPYKDVSNFFSSYSKDGHYFYENGTNEQNRIIANLSDVILIYCYDVADASDIIDYAWANNKMAKVIKAYNNETPKANLYTSVEIKKTCHFTREVKDKDEECVGQSEYIYEFEELLEKNHDHIQLTIRGSSVNLTIVGVSLYFITRILQERYEEEYRDKRLDYQLHYRRREIEDTIFEFNGYSGLWKDDECISLKQQFENIIDSEDYSNHNYEHFGEVPLFNIYKTTTVPLKWTNRSLKSLK